MQNAIYLNPRVSQFAVQTISRLLATYAVVQGVNLIVGGEQRFSGQSFATARYLPGAPASWGVLFIVGGAIALAGSLTGHHLLIRLGHSLCATWCFFLTLGFAFATLPQLGGDAHTSTTGIPTYAALALIYLLVAAVYHQSPREHPYA